MKRILTTLVLACVLTSAWAQDFPAGMRNEIVEIEQNEDEYSLFTYKDEDGAFGYYLSLGRVFPILEAEIFGGQTSISHMDETCLCLGATKEEALATIEQLLALLEEPAGTTAAFQCRRSSGGERLSVPDQANCVVVKRFLQGKRLNFQFVSGGHTADVDLTRSTLKTLRWNLNLGKKLGLAE